MANEQGLATLDGTTSAGVVADASGNLYGTTNTGGADGDGSVFELARDPTSTTGYSSTPTTLASFNGTGNGSGPLGGLIADASGNLYGVTGTGGANGDGTVFELAKNAESPTGYSSTPTTLVTFNGTGNGSLPLDHLIADASGNLYGTTETGGSEGNGTVFEVAKNAESPTGYSSTPTTLVTFNGMNTSGPTNGAGPSTGLIADASGNLYGTTSGGANNNGTVFELARDPTSATGYSSNPTTLATFNLASNGPSGSLIADGSGNLYGVTNGTDNNNGQEIPGTVFEIARDPTSPTGFSSTPTTLVTFTGGDGGSPEGSLIADASGNLYGAAFNGGANNDGTVFEIARDAASPTGFSSTPTTLFNFDAPGGTDPVGSLIADASGNLYGTTEMSGVQGSGPGTVFELTGTGFVVCFAAGTAIRTARGDVAVEALRVGDIVVTAAGGSRPITWLGHRTIDCRRHPRPREVLPVRITAHAFGDSLPERDLFLSPGHPVLVGADEDGSGGHLVPIMCLINGTTIERVRVDAVTYWHVELDAHDILLANGLAAESYLDWGDRTFFTEGAGHALDNPDFVVPGLAGRCRPVAVDGPMVEAELRRLDMVFAMRLATACAWPRADAMYF